MLLCQQTDKFTDEKLVSLVLENHHYYLCLVKRYENKILRYVYRLSSLKREDCEDLVQEIFLKAYKNLNSFSQNLKFSTWLYRIAHNITISNYRKLQARPKEIYENSESSMWDSFLSDLDIVKEVNNQLLNENIWKILDKLPAKYREVLVLRFLEELEYKEISDVLRKPVNTVGTLIRRAKKQFVKVLEKEKINLS